MAQIEDIIPLLLHLETGLAERHMALPPEQQYRMAHATGCVKLEGDLGGHTVCGVTLATYRSYRASHGIGTTGVDDLTAMTYQQWRQVLRELFWDRWSADRITSRPVAIALVDWTWTSGAWGIKEPQKLLGTAPDGIVGPATLRAVNSHADPRRLLREIQQARRAYNERICVAREANRRFLRGWQNRVDRVDRYIARLT